MRPTDDVQHPVLLLPLQKEVEHLLQEVPLPPLAQVAPRSEQVLIVETEVPLSRPLRVCDDDWWPLRRRTEQVRQELEQGVQPRRVPKEALKELEEEQEKWPVEVRTVLQQELPVAPLAQSEDLLVRLPQRMPMAQLEARHL